MHSVISRHSVTATLEEGVRALEQAGFPDAAEEATALWAGLSGTAPAEVWLTRDRDAPRHQRQVFANAVQRRVGGEPRAYVVGSTGFRTLDLKVNRRVLIPRPETEGLVECVLDWARGRTGSSGRSWGRAADVGTGCGCIALSLAVEGRFSGVVATDISRNALAVARENVAWIAPPIPLELRHGSLCGPLRGETFGVIVSNPPYVTAQEHARLDATVRRYEPRSALVSGADGMEHTRQILKRSVPHLVPGGLIALEVDCTRAEVALAHARAVGWSDAWLERDLFGRLRYLLATREIAP